MSWRTPYEPSGNEDDLDGPPPEGPYYQWGLGVVAAVAAVAYGARAIAVRDAAFGATRNRLPLHGTNAVVFGAIAVSSGLFLHCHYFWGNVYEQAWPAVLGKIVGLAGVVGGMCVLIYRVGFLGAT